MSIYTTEKGFKIEITIKDENGVVVDLTGATVSYSIRDPLGVTVVKTATIDNAAGGVTSYTTTTTTDYNSASGKYLIQPKITLSNGNIFYGTTIEFDCFGSYQ